MLAGTAFACLFYLMNGKRDRVWLYTVAACSFITYPIICEIWEFTCGGTIIVPGDYFCCFMLLLMILTGSTETVPAQARTLLTAGVLLTPVISSAESIAPVYVTAVLIILFYRYCVRRTARGRKTAWFFEGVRFAIPLFIAFVLRLVIGYGIMGIMGLKFKHTGDTSIGWKHGEIGSQLIALFKGILINYGAAARPLLYPGFQKQVSSLRFSRHLHRHISLFDFSHTGNRDALQDSHHPDDLLRLRLLSACRKLL